MAISLFEKQQLSWKRGVLLLMLGSSSFAMDSPYLDKGKGIDPAEYQRELKQGRNRRQTILVVPSPPASQSSRTIELHNPALAQLDQHLEELTQSIRTILKIQEDIPLIQRLSIEAKKTDLPQNERLEGILPRPPRLQPAEDLLRADHHTLLLSLPKDKLDSTHKAFEGLTFLIQDLEALLEDEELSPLHSSFAALRQYYTDFIDQLCQSETEDRRDILSPKIRIKGDRLDHCLMGQKLGRNILSKNRYGFSKRHKNKQEGGQSAVKSLGGVHFKAAGSSANDIDPAMEWAMHAFHFLLVGQGTTPSTTLSLKKVIFQHDPNEPLAEETKALRKQVKLEFEIASRQGVKPHEFFAQYPQYQTFFAEEKKQPGLLQASKTMGDMSLYEFLEEVKLQKKSLADLDPTSFSALVMASLITVPSDAKDDNIRVSQEGSKWRLVGIDNDRALAHMIVSAGDRGHYVQGKNILYLLGEPMQWPVDKTIRQRIRDLEAPCLILDWLRVLEQQNQRYEALMRVHHLHWLKDKPYFPLHLSPDICLTLLHRLSQLQQELKDPSISHQTLLSKFYPVAALFYQELRRIYHSDPHYAQQVLYGGKGIPDTSIETLIGDKKVNREHSIMEVLQEETTLPDEYETQRSQTIEEAITSFLDKLIPQELSTLSRLGVFSRLSHFWPDRWGKSWQTKSLAYNMVQDLCQYHLSLEEALSILRYVLNLPGVDLNYCDEEKDNETLLHLLAGTPEGPHQLELLEEVLAKGINIEVLNSKSQTPLDKAILIGNQAVILKLLDQGAGLYLQSGSIQGLINFALTDLTLPFEEVFTGPYDNRLYDLAHRNPEVAWFMSLTFLFASDPTAPSSPLKVIAPHIRAGLNSWGIDNRSLKEAYKKQIFDHSQFKSIYQTGRDLGLIEVGNQGWFFKRYPASGMEAAVNLLTRFLFPEIGFYTTLANINDEPYLISLARGRDPTYPRNTKDPFQAYRTNNLAEVLKRYPKKLNYLDSYYLSQSILMAMLINPEDGKPNNYIIEPSSRDPKRYRLISIDNDQAFAPELTQVGPSINPQVRVKSILFCLDQMQEKIDPKVIQKILAIDPYPVLISWLKELNQIHTSYQSLFSEPQRKSFAERNSYIEIPFQKNDARLIAQKLIKMQLLLKDNPNLTHLGLLKEVSPLAYHHYRRAFKEHKNKSVQERFEALDGPCYGRPSQASFFSFKASQSRDVHTTLTSSGELLRAKGIPVGKERAKVRALGETYDPMMVLQELQADQQRYNKQELMTLVQQQSSNTTAILRLLEQEVIEDIDLNLQDYLPQQQHQIIDKIRDLQDNRKASLIEKDAMLPPLSLTLKYAWSLTKTSFNFETLKRLNIQGCQSITEDFVITLSRKALRLSYLNMSDIASLKSLKNKALLASNALFFPILKYLILNKNGNLQSIHIQAPLLEELQAANGVSLTEFKLYGSFSNIKRININGHCLSFLQLESLLKALPKEISFEALPNNKIKVSSYEAYSWGRRYEEGSKVAQSDDQAASRYIKVWEKDWRSRYALEKLALKGNRIAVEGIKVKAEEGREEAQYILSQLYEKGIEMEQSDDQAAYWYTKTWDKEELSRDGLERLAFKGNRIAVEGVKVKAEEGREEAQYILGQLYEKGIEVEQSDDQAAHWYKKAWARKKELSFRALYNLDPKGKIMAADWIKAKAEEGDYKMQLFLAQMYKKGIGIDQSDDQAVHWYAKTWDEDWESRNNLEKLALKGNQVAADWIKAKAEEGREEAYFILSQLYEKGTGLKQSDDQAAKWYIKASQKKSWQSLGALGRLALKGNQIAADGIRINALQGYEEAQFILGQLYERGIGVDQSDDQATYWYAEAWEKEKGQSFKALYNLALKGNRMAADWIKTKASGGNKQAQSVLAQIQEKEIRKEES
ncbi:MAG: SEL1-like repeat protein [Candidatus Paracaedibacteraceae bacterium]|nr:SEL1-like repeat protein [Candidatus Paracaedibacteraceae bacterium]